VKRAIDTPVAALTHVGMFRPLPSDLTSAAKVARAGTPVANTMTSSLISPKPVSYMQHYNPQQQSAYTPYGSVGGIGAGGAQQQQQQPYSETPSLAPTPGLLAAGPHAALTAQGGYMSGALAGFGAAQQAHSEEGKIYALVIDLMDASTREAALLELSKKREQYDELALVLWHSFGMYL
jgi:CCR4-NOT transcription complex subunit 9